ncbi:hypothetical protein [Vibrio sp. M260118]|uniref:hypothetical protein n=1 Tax=Vibrio sp. M260118 TaxID=3020896 RepID=UPI002F3F2FAA
MEIKTFFTSQELDNLARAVAADYHTKRPRYWLSRFGGAVFAGLPYSDPFYLLAQDYKAMRAEAQKLVNSLKPPKSQVSVINDLRFQFRK